MLESGTKTLSLPSELYGCPYPVNPALPPGTCAAPDLCNCYTGICFGTCKGEPSWSGCGRMLLADCDCLCHFLKTCKACCFAFPCLRKPVTCDSFDNSANTMLRDLKNFL